MDNSRSEPPVEEFDRRETDLNEPSLPVEFLMFLRHNKKWWLLPIFVALLIFGVFIFLSGTGAAPFIYTLH